jgi:hypothetical protein
MERDRWHQLITIGVVASLAVSIVSVGIGVKALRKAGTTATTTPVATIIMPGSGDTLSGTKGLAARSLNADVTAVDFVATGGSLHDTQISTTGNSTIGWLGKWDTTTVSNGTYQIVAVAYDASGHSGRSSPVNVTVKNF